MGNSFDELASRPAAADSETFAAIIAPLELLAANGGPPEAFNGPGRAEALAAFRESPDGFRACVLKALQRAQSGKSQKPLGLLVRMVRDGDHRAAPPDRGIAKALAWARASGQYMAAADARTVLDEFVLSDDDRRQVDEELALLRNGGDVAI